MIPDFWYIGSYIIRVPMYIKTNRGSGKSIKYYTYRLSDKASRIKVVIKIKYDGFFSLYYNTHINLIYKYYTINYYILHKPYRKRCCPINNH